MLRDADRLADRTTDAVIRLMCALEENQAQLIKSRLEIDCCLEKFDEDAVLSALDGIAVFVCSGSLKVTDLEAQEKGEEGSAWRYVFDPDKEKFVRMNARVVWEEDRTGAYRGKGWLKVSDGAPQVEKILSGSLFRVSVRDNGIIAVSYKGRDFDPTGTAAILQSIAEYAQAGSVIIGRADDGPDMAGVERWKFMFGDGKMTFKIASSVNWV